MEFNIVVDSYRLLRELKYKLQSLTSVIIYPPFEVLSVVSHSYHAVKFIFDFYGFILISLPSLIVGDFCLYSISKNAIYRKFQRIHKFDTPKILHLQRVIFSQGKG